MHVLCGKRALGRRGTRPRGGRGMSPGFRPGLFVVGGGVPIDKKPQAGAGGMTRRESPQFVLLQSREEFPHREDVDPILGALGPVTEIHDHASLDSGQSVNGP